MFGKFFHPENSHFLNELRDPILLRSYQKLKSLSQTSEYQLLFSETDLILGYLWERIHDGKWLDVHPNYRYFYGYITAIHGYYSWMASTSKNDTNFLLKLFRLLDLGLLLGSPESVDLLQEIIALIQSTCTTDLPLVAASYSVPSPQSTIPPLFHPSLRRAIPAEHCPDLLSFFNHYFILKRPVVIKASMQEWPALSLWKDLNYINSGAYPPLLCTVIFSTVAGYRTVPIEIGNNYLSESSGQKLMTMNDFLCHYLLPHIPSPLEDDDPHPKKRNKTSHSTSSLSSPSPPMGYLAQHCLFDHIPLLKSHFLTPDYCCLLAPEDEEEHSDDKRTAQINEYDHVITNGWLGPLGTISPLHHDPYNNLLAQVHGRSFPFLAHPNLSHHDVN
jgi:[protein]-arginine 3-hydroxylase / protease